MECNLQSVLDGMKVTIDSHSEMNFYHAIKTCRAIRISEDKPIPRETLEQLTELATYAPSNCNVQELRFIIVDDQELKEQLTDMGASIPIHKAPQGILILYDHRSTNSEYQDWLQSGAAATQNLLLAAHALGLGTCWMCHLPPRKHLRTLLGVPAFLHRSPTFSSATVRGCPLRFPGNTIPRNSLDTLHFKMVHLWRRSVYSSCPQGFLILIYYRILRSFKKLFLNSYIDRKFVKKFEN
jgi:hypothetical protein